MELSLSNGDQDVPCSIVSIVSKARTYSVRGNGVSHQSRSKKEAPSSSFEIGGAILQRQASKENLSRQSTPAVVLNFWPPTLRTICSSPLTNSKAASFSKLLRNVHAVLGKGTDRSRERSRKQGALNVFAVDVVECEPVKFSRQVKSLLLPTDFHDT